MSATIWGVSSCFFVVESIEEHQLDSHRVEWFAVCILLNDFSIVDHVDGFYLFSDRVIILEHFDLRVGLELNTNKTKASIRLAIIDILSALMDRISKALDNFYI